jgi:transposase
MTTLQILQKQNKDLRTQVKNAAVQEEIKRLELQEHCDRLLGATKAKDRTILMLQREIATLNEENKTLREALEEARDLSDRYRAICEKDSTTSSKPPSTDAFKKPKVYSTRRKSGRKPGGQRGHAGHTLRLFANPTTVIERRPPEQCDCGGKVACGESYTAKQQVDILVVPVIAEERVYSGSCAQCGRKHSGVFSDEYVNPVQYGAGIKAMVASLNAYGNVTNHKVAEFLKSVTGGLIRISDGTVVNTLHELSAELEETIAVIKARLIAGKILYADETGCRVNGSLDWMQIFCNDEYTLFGRNGKRGGLCIETDEILLFFTGVLIHDHFKTYYNYKHITHAECNAHILRYLEAIIKIQQHAWAQEMAAFLRRTLHRKKELLATGCSSFREDEVQEIRTRYLEILAAGQAEYNAAIAGKKNITYYNDERCLLNRLKECMEQHLLFVLDFDVPFDNNNAEQGARFLKSKKKVAGCFRSVKGADDYARVASLIATLRKQQLSIFEVIRDLFSGIPPPFVTSAASSCD